MTSATTCRCTSRTGRPTVMAPSSRQTRERTGSCRVPFRQSGRPNRSIASTCGARGSAWHQGRTPPSWRGRGGARRQRSVLWAQSRDEVPGTARRAPPLCAARAPRTAGGGVNGVVSRRQVAVVDRFSDRRTVRQGSGAGDGRFRHLERVVDVEDAAGASEATTERPGCLIEPCVQVEPGAGLIAEQIADPGPPRQIRMVTGQTGHRLDDRQVPRRPVQQLVEKAVEEPHRRHAERSDLPPVCSSYVCMF